MDGDVIVTVRMLMVGKEIGGIIGKGGANVAAFREESGARITISTAQSSPERIVTITGGQSQIHKACKMISEKMDKDVNAGLSSGATNKVPVTIRLIVPASQCGSIIGKGGVKIKEIRDSTGCSIQVQSEMLPNSSERTVTLSGAPTTIIHCIDMLIDVMIQYPAKTATVPYKPQGGNTPIIFHHGQAYVLQGQYAIPGSDVGKVTKPNTHQRISTPHDCTSPIFDDEPSSSTTSSSACDENRPMMNLPVRLVNAATQEITVGNDMMGCIIGKGGSRINEIRSLSGAQIKISQGIKEERIEESEEGSDAPLVPPQERKIIISGTPEEISLASYLINLRFCLRVSIYGEYKRHNL
ncbi:poly(rC)-binding protein 3-like isoform X2 [Clavelina lepadiformis]|uniref:poly(rC)-binding protein 3-like isoform X2 n=1 Tax=Clavelina lepadiformis TaxID=159417 RepID=UPI004043432C